MRIVRILLASLALGAGLAMGAHAPADAAQDPSSRAVIADATAITGEPWSAPQYPVGCQTAGGQGTCTPTSPTNVTAQTCYLGVLVAGERTTVCTTYEDHADAIQADGGKVALVEYGCSIGDVACITFENAGRGMAMSATAMMYAVAANMRFDTSSLLWDAATGEWSFWAWAILVVTFGSMVWAVTAAVVSGDRGEVVAAVGRSFLAVAAVPITLWLTGHLLNAMDDMTWYIMNRDGPTTLFATLQGVMWAGGQANYFFAFLIHGLLMVGMLLLMLVFTFRNIVLAALIAVGPVAWMLFPVRGLGPQWVVRYVSAVVVLLLTGPLTIGFVTLIINGLSAVSTIWDPQAWPLLFGLALVAFAPFAIFGLFSFVGAVAADGVGSRLGSHAGHLGGRAARTAVAIPTRLGSAPAGVAASAKNGTGRPATATTSGADAAKTSTARGASSPANRTAAATSTAPQLARATASPPQRSASSPPPPSSPRVERTPS
ncbi:MULTISPECIES: hypothetical protein [Microbacterium]|uniref:hypothetical protein n=1 Tax=Microbacterium TaxID=33882 RepID=UPI00146E3411|nr:MULTISPECIES: hypothetical protein [Microbacterium]